MLFVKPNPFDFLLEKTKEASGTTTVVDAFFAVHFKLELGVVFRQPHSALYQNSEDVLFYQVVFVVQERKIFLRRQRVVGAFQEVEYHPIENRGVEIQ